MRRRAVFTSILGVVALMAPAGQRPSAQQRPPSFVLIFCDDLGYADIGPFSPLRGARRPVTPNLDRMAAEGIRLTDFHVSQAVCSASRAA